MTAAPLRNIADILQQQARLQPQAPAAACDGNVVSYAALQETVCRACAWIKNQGIVAGDVVIVALADPLLHLAAVLASARMGVAHLALTQADGARRCAALAKRVGAIAVLADFPEAQAYGLPVLTPGRAWLDPESPREADDMPAPHSPQRPLFFKTSSGTTGEPKLFCLTHKAYAERLGRDFRFALPASGEYLYTPVSLAFLSATSWALYSLQNGGGILLASAPTPLSAVVDWIDKHPVRNVVMGPVHTSPLLDMFASSAGRFPGLRSFALGTTMVGERLRADVMHRLTPNLYVMYGTNEAGIVAVAGPEQLRGDPRTVGTPVTGASIEIVDEKDRPLPPGETGVIRMRAPGMITSYVGDERASAKAFRDGWYFPGDVGALSPSGALAILGRTDDMMIFNGINIYPGAIEAALERHPDVAEAAAFGLASARHGQIPAAAVVLKARTDMHALLRHCREWLGATGPKFLMQLPYLPRNAAGKVLKRELADLAKRRRAARLATGDAAGSERRPR